MMKRLAILMPLLLLLGGWDVHGKSVWNGGLSQGQGGFLQVGYDDAFINAFKGNQDSTTAPDRCSRRRTNSTRMAILSTAVMRWSTTAAYTPCFLVLHSTSVRAIVLFSVRRGRQSGCESQQGLARERSGNVNCQYSSNGGALIAGDL